MSDNSDNRMFVRFWGVRGSIPCAHLAYQRYGGDTSCVSIEADGHLLIFDAGSGIRRLGSHVFEKGYTQSHLFFSHVHMDHIVGYPFYGPLWHKNHRITVYADHLQSTGGVYETLFRAFAQPIFPVPLDQLSAKINYVDLECQQVVSLGSSIRVSHIPLNHPNGATGYRIDYKGSSVCYITDTEHKPEGPDQMLLRFIQNADLLIYDSTYTDEEYPTKVGWGHSTWQEGIKLCRLAHVKQFCVFHHAPEHDDDAMDQIAVEAQKTWGHAFVAHQGMCLSYPL